MGADAKSEERVNGIDLAIPFLKWAGGKRWLIASRNFEVPDKFHRYHEPFLGGGSFFFSLRPTRAALSDLNQELITTYGAIRDYPHEVWRKLSAHSKSHDDSYYYEVRDQRPRSATGIASRLIYLNRTCWNGLYRVNLRGRFNVPRGTKDQVLFPTDDFVALSRALRGVDLKSQGYEKSLEKVESGDFVFLDPPYTVKHNTNGFVKYNETLFSWADQERLAEICDELDRRGAFFLLTNADHESVRALYDGRFKARSVSRKSIIAGRRASRATVTELLVSNYF